MSQKAERVPFVPWHEIENWRSDWSGLTRWFFITEFVDARSKKAVEVLGSRMDEGRVILYSKVGREVFLHLPTQVHYSSGGDQSITIPGGGLKQSEDPETCIRRELLEEIGARYRQGSAFEIWTGYRSPYLYDKVTIIAAELEFIGQPEGGDEEDFESSTLLSTPIPLSQLEVYMARTPSLFRDAVTCLGLMMFKLKMNSSLPI